MHLLLTRGHSKISESLKQISLIGNDHRESPLETVIEFDDDDDEPLCLRFVPPNSPQ